MNLPATAAQKADAADRWIDAEEAMPPEPSEPPAVKWSFRRWLRELLRD